MSQIAKKALLRHLHPDLANMALECCWNQGNPDMNHICKYGNYEQILTDFPILYMISDFPQAYNANGWNYGFCIAAASGYIKIIKMMIKKGAYWFASGFISTCGGGHIEIVKLMIANARKEYTSSFNFRLDWNNGFYNACGGDYLNLHAEIAKFLIKTGNIRQALNFNYICMEGCAEIVELLIQYDPHEYDWKEGLNCACIGNYKNPKNNTSQYVRIAKLMIKRGANGCNCGMSKCLYKKIMHPQSS